MLNTLENTRSRSMQNCQVPVSIDPKTVTVMWSKRLRHLQRKVSQKSSLSWSGLKQSVSIEIPRPLQNCSLIWNYFCERWTRWEDGGDPTCFGQIWTVDIHQNAATQAWKNAQKSTTCGLHWTYWKGQKVFDLDFFKLRQLNSVEKPRFRPVNTRIKLLLLCCIQHAGNAGSCPYIWPCEGMYRLHHIMVLQITILRQIIRLTVMFTVFCYTIVLRAVVIWNGIIWPLNNR